MFVFPREVVSRSRTRMAAGVPLAAIARVEAVSPRTLRRWRLDWSAALGRGGGAPSMSGAHLIGPEQEPHYVYLLGLYLGDGHLATAQRGVYRLELTMDSRYPALIAEAGATIRAVMPANRVCLRSRQEAAAVVIACYSKRWPSLFPQHGAGSKHQRKIALASWQLQMTAAFPERLIRGLIHSDGCRYVASQRADDRIYRYARYGFTNRSSDIRQIFCDHLDMLNIRWTLASKYFVQIARREAVDRLDEFVGHKR